jgi:hypothetical protein
MNLELNTNNTKEKKTITYEEVEKRLKNIKLEDFTSKDVIDRYIAYGDAKDFENLEVQKLLIKHGYIEELICSVETVITDKTIIDGIINSNLFKNGNFKLINGKIQSLDIVEDKELVPMGMCWLIINFVENNNKYKIKYMYYDNKQKEYKNEIAQYIGKNIYVIVTKDNSNNDFRLCCFLKNNTKNKVIINGKNNEL